VNSSATTPKTDITCSNPRCSQKITITVEQKIELLEENFLKYGKISLIYCCKACQDEHLQKLSESKFVRKGTLKNHEYALIVHDADVTKRQKGREVHLITGNIRELRASVLREKLSSVIPRDKRKYMTSKEVQDFFIKDTSGKLKANSNSAATVAWRTMNKCEKMFPLEVSIFELNEKDRGIEYIKREL